MFKYFVDLDVLLGHGRWARPVHLIQQLKQQEVNYNQRYHLLPKITARCLVWWEEPRGSPRMGPTERIREEVGDAPQLTVPSIFWRMQRVKLIR